MRVPADVRIVQLKSTYCAADEASLTGESEPVDKWDEIVSTNTVGGVPCFDLFCL